MANTRALPSAPGLVEWIAVLHEQVPVLQRALETHQRMRGAEGTGRELTESLLRYNEEATVKAMEVLYAFDVMMRRLPKGWNP